MNYHKRLYDLRTDNDLRQEDVANILGKSKQTYGRYENGKRGLNIEDLIKLAKFYNVSTDYILGLTNDPTPLQIATIKNQVNINGDKNKINMN